MILPRVGLLDTRLGLNTEFTGCLILVTAHNHDTFTILHNVETTAAVNNCYIFTTHCLVAASNNGDFLCFFHVERLLYCCTVQQFCFLTVENLFQYIKNTVIKQYFVSILNSVPAVSKISAKNNQCNICCLSYNCFRRKERGRVNETKISVVVDEKFF
jgi:hypothetical protein